MDYLSKIIGIKNEVPASGYTPLDIGLNHSQASMNESKKISNFYEYVLPVLKSSQQIEIVNDKETNELLECVFGDLGEAMEFEEEIGFKRPRS